MLVRNRVADQLELDPGAVRDSARRHPLLLRVAAMLDLPPRPLWEQVHRQLRQDPVAPVMLATDIDVHLKWYLQENPATFRGLSVAQVPLRYYPSDARLPRLRPALGDRRPSAPRIPASMATSPAR